MKKPLLIALALFSMNATSTLAANILTCPTKFQQDKSGYWVSNDTPGWKSTRPSSQGITLDAKNFGGAVLEIEKKRIFCIYRGSHGRWIGLISNPKHPFTKDDLIPSSWTYNQMHHDYTCGQPEHKLNTCQFKMN